MNCADKIKNQRGVSLIEMVLASAISLVVIVSVMNLTSSISKNQIKQNKAKDSFYGQEAALTAAKSILFDVYSNKTGKRTEGLCRNLSVENPRPGVNYVELYLDFSFFEHNTRWAKKIPSDWRVISCDEKINIKSRYKKCFKLNKGGQVYFSAAGLNTINIDAKNGSMKSFSKDKKKEDIKKIAFDFNTIIFNHEKTPVKSNKLFIPAADVGYCELERKRWFSFFRRNKSEKDYYKVYPSGSGLVEDSGKNIYNSTSFEKEKNSLLDFKLLKPGVQAGKLDGENLSVDSRYNVELTCNEKTFKCSNSNSSRVFDKTLDLDVILSYNPGRPFPDKINSNVSVSFSSYGDSLEVRDGDINSQINRKNTLPLRKGTNNYSLEIQNISGVCNKICSAAEKNSFYKGNFAFELYRGSGQSRELLKKRPEVFSSSGEVACTTCYMKSCARLGLGTFGPVQRTNYSDGHPIEPLDGNIPECAAGDKKEVNSFAKVSKVANSATSCVSGDFASGSLSLRKESCSQKLPIMCFSFGKFRLARDINSGRLIKANKSKASKICFEQGVEILDREKVKDWLNMGAARLENYFGLSGDKFKFINLSNQGAFFAPQTDEQIADTIRDFKKNLTSLNDKFWIGYELNASGYALGALPVIYNTKNNPSLKESALYFGLNSGVNIRKPSNTLEHFKITDGKVKAGVLLHNIKHKGVAFVDSEQARSISYVCFSLKRGFFLSLKKGKKYVDGVSACKSEEALFYPPQSPLQWVSVLLEINKNEYNKPFPDKKVSYYKSAWVAVEPSSGGMTSYTSGRYLLHSELSNLPLTAEGGEKYESVYDLIKSNKTVPQILDEKKGKTL